MFFDKIKLSIFLFLAGFTILILVNNLIRFYILHLRKTYILKGIDPINYQRATKELGFLESLIYALTYTLGHPEFIGLWLGLKTIGRWSAHGPNSEIDHFENISDEADRRERKNAQINIYLIGNLLVVILGLIVGLIWKLMPYKNY